MNKKKLGKNINSNHLNDCIFWYKYPEKHQNGIAVLKINNVPAGEYDIKIQYDGNSHYKNTSAVHHAVILKIEKTRSLDEILQSGEYKKKIGDYQIVEYNYMGDMESALVEDSRGKKWIMSGDGFTSV